MNVPLSVPEPPPPRAPRRRRRRAAKDPSKVAVLSLHTSPLDPPGSGDSGGMNVYIREVAERLAAQGVQVDVFTRWRGRGLPGPKDLPSGGRVIELEAGPPGSVPKEDLPRVLPAFLGGVLEQDRHEGGGYDVLHSHYWLSGWVGQGAKEIWGVPLVATFHTLGRVKNEARGPSERREPERRLSGEERVVEEADRILTPTPGEAHQLVGMYGARPDRIRVIPPGVDHGIFFPRHRDQARARLHLAGVRLVLFVGRLQAHKGPDLAVRAVAEAVARDPEAMRDVVLAVVGGPSGSGSGDEVSGLIDLATSLGVANRVILFPPQPQLRLADFYAAAEAVLMPSRSESFGLVALEAQACGTPVIASAVGGLRYAVADGRTGFLVPGHDAAAYAERLIALLSAPREARRMGERAVVRSLRFSWDLTAAATLRVYRELIGPGAGSAA